MSLTVRYHLSKILKITKPQIWRTDQWLLGLVEGERCGQGRCRCRGDCTGTAQRVFVVMEQLCTTIVGVVI